LLKKSKRQPVFAGGRCGNQKLHADQLGAVPRTCPGYLIPGTPFELPEHLFHSWIERRKDDLQFADRYENLLSSTDSKRLRVTFSGCTNEASFFLLMTEPEVARISHADASSSTLTMESVIFVGVPTSRVTL
jgi:hypothetical protein